MILDVHANLAKRGLTLPVPPRPGGSYESVRVIGEFAHVAAQFPFLDDTLAYRGRLGRELTTEDGYRAAELCALNVLAQIERYAGLDRIRGLARIDAYMQTEEGWDDFPRVLDGASQLFLDALGDAGRHARALFGVERLPIDAPIEMTALFALHP